MLTQKMLTGVWMLANGRPHKNCYEAAGVSERTFYTWLKRDDFQAAVALLKEQQPRPQATPEEHKADLDSSRSDELETLKIQRQIVSGLGALTLDFVEHLKQEGVENFGVRQFPAFAKAFSDAVTAMQNTNDRLIGLETLIVDVERLESEMQLRLEGGQNEVINDV